ncbi:unnamed protein product [Clonostachys rhizophaga]|uniref:Nephrocystin 3-like N-terminal domain-containing protein n=1 Tax=Clonostachys rhizophaga TaxID=160324 RepID=A0A9N9YTZ6_9HYPO|nr:unnamed protein product [Clonostachys rhizophaga]
MAPGIVSPAPISTSHFPISPLFHGRRISIPQDDENYSATSITRYTSRASSRKMSMVDTSNISNVVYSLRRRSSEELGSTTSSKLLGASHESILDWISTQRMSHLPPEGSSHDKVLAWAQLFVERLNSFDLAISEFAGDSYIATQLAYGYCAILLELGKENAPALMISFGFFYNMSVSLVNLLERTELFSVSQEIREQLVLALSDLVTLVASVSTHFHKAIRGLTSASVSVNIYSTFTSQIKAFIDRCDKTAEAMWRHQLVKEGLDLNKVSSVKAIKAWVSPEDHVLANVANSMSHLAHDREELTCLWIGPYLTRFLKGSCKTLSISGKQGSGKTVLSSVIVDYLQHPVGGVAYNTLFIPINSRIPAETSSRAIAKTILSQLFDKRIGNVQLLEILSDACEKCSKAANDGDYDNIVWSALDRALSAALPGAKELVIVVDGIDEASCREATLLQKLNNSATKGTNVKLITLGAEKTASADAHTSIQINEDLIFDDIMAVVRGHFDHTKAFASLSELEQETLVNRITTASKGSFLWAKLATKRVRNEPDSESLKKAIDSIMQSAIVDFVTHTLSAPSVTQEAKKMLLWLATAERPLSLKELASLLSIQLDKTILDQPIDVLSHLRPVNSLVFLQDGLAYIRHGLTRNAILDLFAKGKLVPEVKDYQTDFTTRLLFYIKTTITQQHEPSLDVLDAHETAQLVNKFPLLDFAIRYWPVHFRRTPTYVKEGDSATVKKISKYIPNSSTFILLQGALWDNRPTPQLLAYQAIVTDICRQVLSTKSTVTLQAVILMAVLYRRVGYTTESVHLFHEATTMANTLLSPRHPVTMQTASAFLELTSSMATNTKTEIMVKREDALLVLLECYKAQYGQNSEMVMSTWNRLVEHYQLTKEDSKAQEIISSIGSSVSNGGVVLQREGDLHVHLKGHKQKEVHNDKSVNLLLDVEEHDELIERTDSYDFEYSIKQAEKQIKHGHVEAAEHSYIEIWQHASRQYCTHHSELWEKRKMKAVLEYSKFLKTQKRETESASLLSSVWEEYKQSSMAVTESSVSLFHEMATVMKSLSLTSESLSVLKHCSQFYQNTNRTQSSSYKEIQQSIQTTSRELVSSISSYSSSETLLEEIVLEASNSISTMDDSSFAAVNRLVGFYISQHRWQDATQLIKRVLRGVWPSIFSSSVQDVIAPTKHVQSCVELAERLAECYHARRRLQREEDIRLRIYRSMRVSRGVSDKLRERVTVNLLGFFQRGSQVNQVINIRQEMLDDYTTELGPEDPTVIKMLWTLAELTRPRPVFVEYYQKIISALNKGHETCKPETFEPCAIVATELWNKGLFSEALPYYRTLFTTFLKQPKLNPKFNDQEFDRELYTRYTYCLRSIQSDFNVLHKVTVDYQSQCKSVFGTNASITIQATLSLARVCQESKRYELDAVTLYEELLKIKSTEVDHTEISSILDSIYEEQADLVASSKFESSSATQTERAVKILQTRISSARETYGWAHSESLTKLSELVKFYSKQQHTDKVVNELQDTTVNVLSSETRSSRLIAAASTIASSYIASNQVHKATELKEDIYRQIILKDTASTKSQFDLSFRGRESLVFLAQLEHCLSRNSAAVNDILADLTTQYVYVQEFRSLIKAKSSSIQKVTVATSRLHQCLISSGRQAAAARVMEDYKQYFIMTEGQKLNLTKPSEVDAFLDMLLQHFNTHKSNNFLRSVGIASNAHVLQLLKTQNYERACDLASASFTYISARDEYQTPGIAKFVLILGMTIAGRHLHPKPHEAARKRMLSVSGFITQDVLHVLSELNIDLEQISLHHLNNLIGLLGDQRDFKTLSWFLGILWNSREAQRNWRPSVTLALGRRFIMARYLVGESLAAVRLAEDIVYNCRRVYGSRHANTLEMSIFLTQLYTGIAQRYQSQKAGQDIAVRYYKKSAAIHENVLRVFSDPSYAEMEAGLGTSTEAESRSFFFDGGYESPKVGEKSDAEHVREHLQYLKLALERLGSWPKDYAEYQRLNTDVFRVFGAELRGIEGMDKWNLGSFGSGNAESSEDLLDLEVTDWELGEAAQVGN